MSLTSLTPSSLVLVTGANGHVAQHVVSQLLHRLADSRPKVRATVRTESSAAGLVEAFTTEIASGALEIIQIPNLTVTGAFDTALNGCTHVAHVASPLVVGSKDVENEILKPAIFGTTSLLESALKCGSLEAIVITSSFAAVFDPVYGLRPGYTYTPDDWSSLTYEKMADANLDLSEWPETYQGFITYMGSKNWLRRRRGTSTSSTNPTGD